MANVLITGGAGFIGSHLCERLLDAGHAVTILDDFSAGNDENIAAVRDRVTVIRDSILNAEAHRDALKDISLVYHLAALISGNESLREPEDYFRINLDGLVCVLRAVSGNDNLRVVLASSSTVYGDQDNHIHTETSTPAPTTVYALTKLTGEHLLSMYSGLFGFDYTCLRLFNVYGPRQSPNHPYANVTCKFSHAAALDRGIKRFGTGEQSRDFIYVDDVVEAFMLAAKPTKHRLYNVGTGGEASINTLIDLVRELSGNDVPCEQCPPWENDIRRICADIDRIQGELGYQPKVALRDGLRATIEFFRA